MADSGTYAFTSPKALDARRAYAGSLLKSGMDSSPTKHWAEVPSRIIQALVGGTIMGNAEGVERADEQRTSDALLSMPGLGGGPTPTPTIGSARMSNIDGPQPASVRYNNPGAQYPGPSAQRFGSNATGVIGGGHKIAGFPDAESGAAAQFDLLARKYAGMPLSAAIAKWSGGNSAPAYIQRVSRETGIAPDAMLTNDLLRGPQGLALVKSMAAHEAGRPFPMSDDQWQVAQSRAFGQQGPAMLGGPDNAGQGAEPLIPGVEAPGTTQAPIETASVKTQPAAQSGAAIDPATAGYIKQLIANPRTRQYGMQLYTQLVGKADAPTDEMREYNLAVKQGEKQSFTDWKAGLKRAGATTVNIDQKSEAEFNKEVGKLSAKRFNTLIEEGQDARFMSADMQTLADIAGRIKTDGKTAEITAALGPWAEAFGIKIDGLGDLQAYNSLISKLAPRMRAPGSGATSDFDARQFLNSLPSLGQTPEGKQIVQNTFAALNDSKIQAAEIASMAMAGEITQREADKRIRALPDPYEAFRKTRGHAPSATGATSSTTKPEGAEPPKAGAVRRYNPATGRLE